MTTGEKKIILAWLQYMIYNEKFSLKSSPNKAYEWWSLADFSLQATLIQAIWLGSQACSCDSCFDIHPRLLAVRICPINERRHFCCSVCQFSRCIHRFWITERYDFLGQVITLPLTLFLSSKNVLKKHFCFTYSCGI